LDDPFPPIYHHQDYFNFPLSFIFKLGQRAFFGAGKTRSDLYGGDITVSIGDDNIEKTLEAKAEIPWLLSAKQVDVDTTRKYIYIYIFLN